MDSKKSNKIRDIVRLQQLSKKWKSFAKNNSKARAGETTAANSSSAPSGGSGSKSIKFLRKTLSFSDSSFASNDMAPKGFLAVCVGKEMKRYVIPTEYLSYSAFGVLLREAEEEFGFQQEGVLKIPCQVSVFEMILKVVEEKRGDQISLNEQLDLIVGGRCSPESSENQCDQVFPSSNSNAQMIH